MLNELGIYIHIPFCKQKCYYCDFVSYSNKCSEVKDTLYRDEMSNYKRIEHISLLPPEAQFAQVINVEDYNMSDDETYVKEKKKATASEQKAMHY